MPRLQASLVTKKLNSHPLKRLIHLQLGNLSIIPFSLSFSPPLLTPLRSVVRTLKSPFFQPNNQWLLEPLPLWEINNKAFTNLLNHFYLVSTNPYLWLQEEASLTQSINPLIYLAYLVAPWNLLINNREIWETEPNKPLLPVINREEIQL